jgi:FkbM family methyltransferase
MDSAFDNRRHLIALLADDLSDRLVKWLRARARRTGEFRRIVVPIDDMVGIRVIATGRYEATQIDAMKTLIAGSEQIVGAKIPPNGVFLDVGANIGLYTMALAKSFSRTIAFEANPVTFKILDANIAISKTPNVESFCIGVSDEPGQATLYVPRDGNLGWATLHQQVHPDRDELVINLDSLDNLAAAHGFDRAPISVMKIDVEGNEAKVLRGSTKLLNEWGPMVVFELWYEALGKESIDALRACGYSHFYSFRRSLTARNAGLKGYVDSLLHGLPITFDEIDPTEPGRALLVCAVRR